MQTIKQRIFLQNSFLLFVGNIKFLNSILAEIKQDIIPYLAHNSKIIVCPPSIYLSQAKLICQNSSIEIGAQDCSSQENGAFTGEISADMLSDIGTQWVILGHSERRQYHCLLYTSPSPRD